MFRRIEVGGAGVAALIVQIGWRDAAEQLVEWRLGIDRIARIDVALAGPGFGNTGKLHILRSLAVPTEIGAVLARRNVGQRVRCHRGGNKATRKACGGGEETPARRAGS